MGSNYIIPEPPETQHLKTQIKGALDVAIPIAEGKLLQKAPKQVAGVADTILNPPTPQDVIRDFLFKIPSPQNAIAAKKVNVPKQSGQQSSNTWYPMQPLGGNTLSGDPIYHKLEISAKDFTSFDGTPQGYPDLVFNTVLIKCKQQKNVVETTIQGSDDGSVFEYSGLNNYDIELNIIITGQNGVYPDNDIDNIMKLLTAQVSVKVDSWYLHHLNIYEIIIVDYEISQESGGISQQQIIVQAKSNKRATLIIQ